MLVALLAIVAGGAVAYAIFLEIRRGRLLWQLVRWLESERTADWEKVHYAKANIEDSMAKLRERRLADDEEFIVRHEAATNRGRRMIVTVVVAGTAVVALLAAITMFG